MRLNLPRSARAWRSETFPIALRCNTKAELKTPPEDERLRSLELAFKQFQDTTTQDLVLLGIPAEHLTRLTINRQSLEEIAAALPLQQAALDTSARQDTDETAALQVEQSTLSAQLNAPQLADQQNLQALETWSKQLSVLIGSAEAAETQRGLEARIAQIDELPARLERFARYHFRIFVRSNQAKCR